MTLDQNFNKMNLNVTLTISHGIAVLHETGETFTGLHFKASSTMSKNHSTSANLNLHLKYVHKKEI